MIYLLLAILSTALVSVVTRISTDKAKSGNGVLAMNYLMCAVLGAVIAAKNGGLFPGGEGYSFALWYGVVAGVLYLLGFVMFQFTVRNNGVVLSAIFMKLGLLVPMVLSVCLFGERPGVLQIIGFCVAVGAIILINFDKPAADSKGANKLWLIVLLLVGGMADATSKIYEEFGSPALSEQYLFYAFVSALVCCLLLVAVKKEKIGRNEVIYGLLLGIPNFFSARFLLMALRYMAAYIVYPTYSVAGILLVTLAGLLLFSERLGKRQWVAVGAILVALVLLNI